MKSIRRDYLSALYRMNLRCGDEQIVVALINSYLKLAPSVIEEAFSALEKLDRDFLKSRLLLLSQGSSHAGAHELSQYCLKVASSLELNLNWQEVRNEIESLQSQFDQVDTELKTFLTDMQSIQ